MTTTQQHATTTVGVPSVHATIGHVAMHYRPGDEAPARRLFELLGCTLVDNGPDKAPFHLHDLLPHAFGPDDLGARRSS